MEVPEGDGGSRGSRGSGGRRNDNKDNILECVQGQSCSQTAGVSSENPTPYTKSYTKSYTRNK